VYPSAVPYRTPWYPPARRWTPPDWLLIALAAVTLVAAVAALVLVLTGHATARESELPAGCRVVCGP
jgi:hypothetical protein